jgi:hypothetical protein
LRILTLEDFNGRKGRKYEIIAGNGSLPVVLEEVQPLPGSARQGGGFRLVFLGPHTPYVPQGVYPIRRGSEEPDAIFIVPIAQAENGVQYEAVFM